MRCVGWKDIGIIDEVVRVLRYEVLLAIEHKSVTGFTSESELIRLLEEEIPVEQDVDMASLSEKALLGSSWMPASRSRASREAVADRKCTRFLKAKRSDRQLTVPPRRTTGG
jgi:hypothetical protein